MAKKNVSTLRGSREASKKIASFNLSTIDVPLFTAQRETLATIISKIEKKAYKATAAEIEHLDGLQNLLDLISDSIEDNQDVQASKKVAYRGSRQKFKDRFEYQDYLVEIFGAEDLLDQVVKAMGDDEAFKNFDYISQMNDISFEDDSEGSEGSTDSAETTAGKKTAADTSFDEDTVKAEMAAALNVDPEDLTVTEGSDNDFEVSMGKETYRVVENDDAMETMAKQRVRQQLEEEPNIFSPDFLQFHLTMSDTDRRITANDMADSQYDGWKDRDIEKEYIRLINSDVPTVGAADANTIAAAEAKVAELQEKVQQTNAAYIEGSDDPAEDERLKAADAAAEAELSAAEEALDDLNNAAEPDYDKMREELIAKAYDTVYEALKDPYEYFINEQGIYSDVEDLLKSNMVSIDMETAVEAAVSEDGAIHFLSSYDGNYDMTASGFTYWREN